MIVILSLSVYLFVGGYYVTRSVEDRRGEFLLWKCLTVRSRILVALELFVTIVAWPIELILKSVLKTAKE
jgi:hypothetical protein